MPGRSAKNVFERPQIPGSESLMSAAATTPTFTSVLYEKKGAIAYVALNRPKVLNALNGTIIAELKAAFEDARDDSTVRGIVLTGAGEKAFAAGADISEVLNDSPLEAEEKTRFGQALTNLIESLGKPVIAAVNGYAVGGGCELAMACTIPPGLRNGEVRSARRSDGRMC